MPRIMTTTTNATVQMNTNTTTPAPSSTPAPFCFTCGFDFGHIFDGVDNRTAGALLVVLVLMGLLITSVIIACWAHDWCCGAGGYRHLDKHSAGAGDADQEEGPKEKE